MSWCRLTVAVKLGTTEQHGAVIVRISLFLQSQEVRHYILCGARNCIERVRHYKLAEQGFWNEELGTTGCSVRHYNAFFARQQRTRSI
ncbi:MAG: hypothetical protein J4478_03435 [Candidatus Diapherotrites archaeon]|uniref:Uncharacterized protein n=1 Tax=Candidatus Iainarchaeum sp. TaxID=3101447 RepID=A0A8T4KZ47_9ARCH|nr:hypothetical protein [Candidatus Diapherotrites archaeon]